MSYIEFILPYVVRGVSYIGAGIIVGLLFGLTVFVHELGHFLGARLCGLRVEAFSIGLGKAIWKRTSGGTVYKIGLIPFGGYVLLPQLDPSGMQVIQGASEEKTPLPPAAWWRRIIVSLAGPLGNLILAVIFAIIIWLLPLSPGSPKELSFDGAVVGYVVPDSATASAGVQTGDRILAVNGKKVNTWSELMVESHITSKDGIVSLSVSNHISGAVQELNVPVYKNDLGYYYVDNILEAHLCAIEFIEEGTPAALSGLKPGDVVLAVNDSPIMSTFHFIEKISGSGGMPVTIKYYRMGNINTITITPEKRESSEGESRFMIGAGLNKAFMSSSPLARYRNPVDQIRGDFESIGRILKGLVKRNEAGRVAKALGGPILIFKSMWQATLSGLIGLFAFVRFLGINLAVLNLLPFPVLDGGHIVFALWRGVFKREMHPKIVSGLVNIFAVLLIGLLIFISYRDVRVLAYSPKNKTEANTADE